MELNIQNQKIELIQWLTILNDDSVIQKLFEFKNKQTKDWWTEISIDEKSSIEKGIVDANTGNLKPHSEAREIYEKWV